MRIWWLLIVMTFTCACGGPSSTLAQDKLEVFIGPLVSVPVDMDGSAMFKAAVVDRGGQPYPVLVFANEDLQIGDNVQVRLHRMRAGGMELSANVASKWPSPNLVVLGESTDVRLQTSDHPEGVAAKGYRDLIEGNNVVLLEHEASQAVGADGKIIGMVQR